MKDFYDFVCACFFGIPVSVFISIFVPDDLMWYQTMAIGAVSYMLSYVYIKFAICQ